MFKRFIIAVLSSALLGALILAHSSSAATTAAFSDIAANYPFDESIQWLKDRAFVAGYPDGTFKPDNTVNRAEFITMVMAAVSADAPSGADCFSDVATDWYARFVCSAKTQGLVAGYEDGTFKPANNINFAEASAVISRAFKLNPSFAYSVWYRGPVERLAAKGAIPVTIDYPEKIVSRGDMAEIIQRLKAGVSDRPTKTYSTLTAPLPKMASCAELKQRFEVASYKQSRTARYMILKEAVSGDTSIAAPDATSSGLSGGSDEVAYSGTNIQVEGVDEADIVKNDSRYIYMVSGKTVKIIDAYPADSLAQIAEFEVLDDNFTPTDLYATQNRLIVIGSTYSYTGSDFYYGGSKTKVYILDTTVKSSPKQIRSMEFDGYQLSSRKIGNTVYLVMNNNPNIYTILEGKTAIADTLPAFNDSKTGLKKPVSSCADVRFTPQYDDMNFVVVAGIDVNDASKEITKEVVMGSGDTVYASLENIYVAATKYDYPIIGIFNIWEPPSATERTAIHRFALSAGAVTYKATGEVQGRMLNQFSMDENGNYFRVAATTGHVWSTDEPSKNHVYVLNKDALTVAGKLEDLAPGEQIYSVRFMGNRAYLVTFKKIDPFFVIDLSSPSSPRVLGALKIPGFSDYLHPYDENHIIGFGKDAIDPAAIEDAGLTGRGFDFAWYQGMKIALFDVTDPANPTLMFNEVIGDRGTDSEVLQNHKALLYDKAGGLFAFPITVAEVSAEDKVLASDPGSVYGTPVFQGAYFYTLDLANGFTLKGRVTHAADGEQVPYFWDRGENQVRRAIYIGNTLYTISSGKIKALNRDDMGELRSIEMQVKAGAGGTAIY